LAVAAFVSYKDAVTLRDVSVCRARGAAAPVPSRPHPARPAAVRAVPVVPGEDGA
jgi:hypothetical protein